MAPRTCNSWFTVNLCTGGLATELSGEASPGYIVPSSNRSCQTSISALEGQTVKLTFINFHSKQTAVVSPNKCYNFVKIIDGQSSAVRGTETTGSNDVMHMCAVPVSDQVALAAGYPGYVSRGSDVRLMVQYERAPGAGQLMIGYEGTYGTQKYTSCDVNQTLGTPNASTADICA